jgi:hypothetical protein
MGTQFNYAGIQHRNAQINILGVSDLIAKLKMELPYKAKACLFVSF